MIKRFSTNLGNFLLSLSDAIDLASPAIASHQMRTAFIAWQIAEAADIGKERIKNLFIAALFHDIGALSLEDKIKLYKSEEGNVERHCILGEALFSLIPLLPAAKKIVRYHHKPWSLWEEPIDTPDVFDAQVLYLADYLERQIGRKQPVLQQVDELYEKLASIAGSQVHSDVVNLLRQISRREEFWLDLSSRRLYSILLQSGPLRNTEIGYTDAFSMASLFRHMIDFKSRFTATHSTGVAECAVMLAEILGLTESEISKIRIAGYFHDLGKLAVPNSILEKPAKLTKNEFAVIRQHTYFTHSVLSTISGFDQIAEWAAFHHEKLDGSGYPFHLGAESIEIGARIMAVADIYTALAEDRPYRKGMKRKEIETILMSEVKNNAIEGKIVNLLIENFAEISSRVKVEQAIAIDMFEMKFANVSSS